MMSRAFYSRQTILKEVGESGQLKLNQAKILIIGAGGLGHPVATYLAAAGVGGICILDFDIIEESNLNRQVCFTPDQVGLYKANVLADKIKSQNPYIIVQSKIEKVTPQNAEDLFRQFDFIVDCCDNFSTKFLIHDTALCLGKDLVQASIYQYEGQLQVFHFSKKRDSGCLRCLWPDVPEKDCTQNCSESGLIGAVAGVFGSIQAMETVKLILGLNSLPHNSTTLFDLLSFELRKVSWKKDSECAFCNEKINSIKLKEIKYDSRLDFELDISRLNEFQVIDIREDQEIQNSPSDLSFTHWPLSKMSTWIDKIEKDKKYLFACTKGIRSRQLVHELRSQSLNNCFSLFEGLRK